MHLKVIILVVCFVTTAGLPVLQSSDSSRTEALWDYPSQKANQAVDKTEFIKEADGVWKSSLDNSALYSDLSAQSQGSQAEDLQRKLSQESQRLHARLAQELRELRERLSSALAALPTTPLQRVPATAHDHLTPLTRRLRDTLDSHSRELCASLNRYAQGPETANGPAPEQPTPYHKALKGMGRALASSNRELTTRLEEFQTQVSGVAGGPGEAVAMLRRETEGFRTGARSRAQSLRAELGETQAFGEGLSRCVAQFCHASSEENRLFTGRIEQQLKALGQGWGEDPGEEQSIPPGRTGSLGEDFSPKLNALLQDILQILN